jgi:hypothetical protein
MVLAFMPEEKYFKPAGLVICFRGLAGMQANGSHYTGC